MPCKPCAYAGCSRLIEVGTAHCCKHAVLEKRERNLRADKERSVLPERKWYKRKAWRGVGGRRLKQLEQEPLCALCPPNSRNLAEVADHVIPHRGDHGLFWFGELQSLCKPCHDIKKQRLERRAEGGAKVQSVQIGYRRG